jgi:hypothetical protein
LRKKKKIRIRIRKKKKINAIIIKNTFFKSVSTKYLKKLRKKIFGDHYLEKKDKYYKKNYYKPRSKQFKLFEKKKKLVKRIDLMNMWRLNFFNIKNLINLRNYKLKYTYWLLNLFILFYKPGHVYYKYIFFFFKKFKEISLNKNAMLLFKHILSV